VSDLLDGPQLLNTAAAYCLASLPTRVADETLRSETPCAGWDVRMLVEHTVDSLVALTQLAADGGLDVEVARPDEPIRGAELFLRLREQVGAVGVAWDATAAPDALCGLDDQLMWASTAAAVGAIEVTVHTWDLTMACGLDRPIPAGLARDLLDIAPRLVCPAFRRPEFAEPVVVSATATHSEQLLAFLGRDANRRATSFPRT
jgi:uncharacterized protein (TIGR03086 family)